MRLLAVITLLVLALALVQPVAAQSFKPDYMAGLHAFDRKDYVTALAHLRDFAQQGYAQAQFRLGVMYHLGLGVRKDPKAAIRWYRKAANHITGAQFNLGTMYTSGEGVVQDRVMS